MLAFVYADTTNPGVTQTHTYTNAYNAADWTTSSGDDGLVTAYGYDAAGQQRSETVLDGRTPVTTALDAEGRATAIGENVGNTGPYTSSFQYNQDDLPVTVTLNPAFYSNGQVDPYHVNIHVTYDAQEQPLTVTTLLNGAPITATLGYNAQGQRARYTVVSGTATLRDERFSYRGDELGQDVVLRCAQTGHPQFLRWETDLTS